MYLGKRADVYHGKRGQRCIMGNWTRGVSWEKAMDTIQYSLSDLARHGKNKIVAAR